MMLSYRFIPKVLIFVFVLLFCFSFTLSSANESYTVYDSGTVSSTYSDYFKGLASQFPDKDYMFFRSGQYQYVCVYNTDLVASYSGNNLTRLSSGDCLMTVINVGTYNTDTTVNTYTSSNVSVNISQGFIYSNAVGGSADPELRLLNYVFDFSPFIKYLLYTLIIFLLLYICFKFINRRWLIS